MSSGSTTGSGDGIVEFPWDHVYVDGDPMHSAAVYRLFYRQLSKRTLSVGGLSIYPEAAGYGFNSAATFISNPTSQVPDGFVVAGPVDTAYAPFNGRYVGQGWNGGTANADGHGWLQANGGLPFQGNFASFYEANGFSPGDCASFVSFNAYNYPRYSGSGTPPLIYRGPSWQAMQLMVLGLSNYFIDPSLKDVTNAAFWDNYPTPGGGVPTPPRYCNDSGSGYAFGSGSGPGQSPASASSFGSQSGPEPIGLPGRPFTLASLLPYWPNGCGFTRKREREITSLGAGGEPGQRARFVVWNTPRYQDLAATGQTAAQFGLGELMIATPADQVGFSFKLMDYGTPSGSGGSTYGFASRSQAEHVNWHVSPDQRSPPDILTFYGIIKAGDLQGPWIANELRDAINLLTVQSYQVTAMIGQPGDGYYAGRGAGINWWVGCYSCPDGTCRGSPNLTSTECDGSPDYAGCGDTIPIEGGSPPFSNIGPGRDAQGNYTGCIDNEKQVSAPAVVLLADMPATVTYHLFKNTMTSSKTAITSIATEPMTLTWSGRATKAFACTECLASPYVLAGDAIDPGFGPASADLATEITFGNPYGNAQGAYAYIDWTAGFAASDGGYGPNDPGIQVCTEIQCEDEGSPTQCPGGDASGGSNTSGGSMAAGGSTGGSSGSSGSTASSSGSQAGSYAGSLGGSGGLGSLGGGPGSGGGNGSYGSTTNTSGGSTTGGGGGTTTNGSSGSSYNGSGGTSGGSLAGSSGTSTGSGVGTSGSTVDPCSDPAAVYSVALTAQAGILIGSDTYALPAQSIGLYPDGSGGYVSTSAADNATNNQTSLPAVISAHLYLSGGTWTAELFTTDQRSRQAYTIGSTEDGPTGSYYYGFAVVTACGGLGSGGSGSIGSSGTGTGTGGGVGSGTGTTSTGTGTGSTPCGCTGPCTSGPYTDSHGDQLAVNESDTTTKALIYARTCVDVGAGDSGGFVVGGQAYVWATSTGTTTFPSVSACAEACGGCPCVWVTITRVAMAEK